LPANPPETNRQRGREDDLSDAALVLIAHGSTRNAESATPARQHAQELRRRNIFAGVTECFLLQEPRLETVLPTLQAARVFAVPLFISEGYFTREIIPLKLGLPAGDRNGFSPVLIRGSQTVHYCSPVGTHASMTAVILARAKQIVQRHPASPVPEPRETTLFIAGHGTERNGNSRQAIERQVDIIRARDVYADVQPIFMEEEPRISDCHRLARTEDIVIVPFFISDGLHVTEDIPALLGNAGRIVPDDGSQKRQPVWQNPTRRNGRRIWYSAGVGTEPGIAEVILERVREAVGD
jgi:sirohydrochlorin cobaltochelatase